MVDGEEQWYSGMILDVVPGTDDWYIMSNMTMKTKFCHYICLWTFNKVTWNLWIKLFIFIFVYSVCEFSVF